MLPSQPPANQPSEVIPFSKIETSKLILTRPDLGESLAAKNAPKLAESINCDGILIEGDSKQVIDCINAKVKPPWTANSIIQDIIALRDRLNMRVGFTRVS
uniref:RNase H type-1 domain-containing protein n=1 Tax=Nelumbo nucifera TaxID=4432 RepID=A0A822Z1L2_NELNU|nr:TPA_asm: hypothetical protein HUJ06_007986 [Nelumbo nucifera]